MSCLFYFFAAFNLIILIVHVFRTAGKGLWLAFLLPFMLCCSFKNAYVSESYKTLSIVSLGQLSSSICDILFYGQKHSEITIPIVPIGYIFSSTFVSLLLVLLIEQGVFFSLCVGTGSSVAYHSVFKFIVQICPKSFTFGEAAVASQALILYITSYLSNTLVFFPKKFHYCDITATYIIQTGMFSILSVLMISYWFPKRVQETRVFIFTLGTSFLLFVILLPYSIFQINSILWLFKIIFRNFGSIALIVYWVLCCVFAAYYLMKQVVKGEHASTSVRKTFHFAILFVLLPGLTFRPCLMYFASGIAVAVMIMLEACRKLQVTEHWKVLQSCFEAFKDEKDEGELALTPLYLMIGCVAPIWLYPVLFDNFVPLPVLSGILSVAVGDTAASIFGTRFGVIKWPGTSKTVEGTSACIISQMTSLALLREYDIIQPLGIPTLVWIFFAIIIVSLIEAKTDQIDNLALPLLSYILLYLICE